MRLNFGSQSIQLDDKQIIKEVDILATLTNDDDKVRTTTGDVPLNVELNLIVESKFIIKPRRWNFK